MAKWTSNSESGILRKRIQKEKHEELLVFGYACKLFRDDVKAQYIDQGKHLIPWMGEDTLKIDRYDCRGALSELRQHEAIGETPVLTEAEKRLEGLCDEERYYSLRHDEHELEMYKEEELKRLQPRGTEVHYNYDVPTQPEQQPVLEDESSTVFVPSPDLQIPDDIELPETVKVHARIEKTAFFISKQGPQMEILIKTKQADNPQFKFLNKDDRLYKYYQYLLSAIKSGKYKVGHDSTDESEKKKTEEACEEEENGEHYLHPSLITTSIQSEPPPPPPPLPPLPYKPSADCKYSQLVNRIQGNAPQMTYEQQQYYQQYYYAAQYYEYYKQMAQQQQFQGPASCGEQTYAQYCTNPYAQIVSNLSQNVPVSEAKPTKEPLLSLADYGTDSEPENDEDVGVKVPPSETEQIIAKMAAYVVKNGRDFENIVRSKGDARFQFLNEEHEYHAYYRLRVRKCLGRNEETTTTKTKEKKVITPVSFSIKKAKEETQKEIKSALPVEESDEDAPAASMTPPPLDVNTPTPPVVEASPDKIADDLIMEMIDLTGDLEEKRENKRAEDRKKDKIAAAAREKLALQMERKKKAAAFLKLKTDEAVRTQSEILKIDDSEDEAEDEEEEGEIRRRKKSNKKKKSHKRKHSRTRHETKTRHKTKEHKRAKKKRKRSRSRSSKSSASSD